MPDISVNAMLRAIKNSGDIMEKQHVWPDDHWNWPITICHKHGVRCGEMIWVGGQVDLTSEGAVRHADDLATQTKEVMAYFDRVLRDLGADLADLVTLHCFYVNDGSVDETAFLKMVGDTLPEGAKPAVSAVPVPYLGYAGMRVEIEGYAMLGKDGAKLPRTYAPDEGPGALPAPFARAVRCGKMIFVSAQAPVDETGAVMATGDIVAQTKQVMKQVGEALGAFGAGYDDVVKISRWYAGNVGIDDFEPAALACAGHFNEPGPAATGIPVPRHANGDVKIKIGVVAMLGEDGSHLPRKHVWPDSLWDWHVHLPYKHGLKCEEMIFLGGQVSLNKKGEAVHPDDLTAQTHQAMVHIGTILNELGADYDDVCKVLAFYQGDCGPDALHANLPVRASYFSDPGPATTGIPLPALAYPSMVIEIDIFAMKEKD
ncbi:MAG: Rid family hydrolase [Pseudomonadota bacterium]